MAKIKTIIYGTLIYIFFSLPVTVSAAVEYSTVPTEQERAENKTYLPFPQFERMEVVRDGVINNALLNQVDTKRWDEDVEVPDLEWLQVRELDIAVNEIKNVSDQIVIPFVAGIRFKDKGFEGIFVQGTINAQGNILLVMDQGRVVNVEIVKFDDSSGLERFGRKLGFIDKFGSNFIESTLVGLLENYFTQEQPLQNLLSIAGTALQNSRQP